MDESRKIVIPTVDQVENAIAWHKNEIRSLYILKNAVKKVRTIPCYPLLESAGIDSHLSEMPERPGINTINRMDLPAGKDDGSAMAG